MSLKISDLGVKIFRLWGQNLSCLLGVLVHAQREELGVDVGIGLSEASLLFVEKTQLSGLAVRKAENGVHASADLSFGRLLLLLDLPPAFDSGLAWADNVTADASVHRGHWLEEPSSGVQTLSSPLGGSAVGGSSNRVSISVWDVKSVVFKVTIHDARVNGNIVVDLTDGLDSLHDKAQFVVLSIFLLGWLFSIVLLA